MSALDEVPEGWQAASLETVTQKIMVGIASAATHAYRQSGIPMLRNLNIKENKIDDSDILYIDEQYEKAHKNKRLKEGDVLTVRTGYPGVSAVVPARLHGAQCFTSLITRPDSQVLNSHYLSMYINSDYGRQFVLSSEAGGAQKNVNAGSLAKMLVLLPPLEEQLAIVEVLSSWDKAIEQQTRLLELKRERKRGLMRQLLTGKVRFKEFYEDWEQVELGRHVFEVNTRNKGERVGQVLSVTNHSGFVLPEEQFSKRVASADITNYKVVKQGQFAYNPSRLNVGSLARLDRFAEGVVSPLYVVFDTKPSVDRNYLLEWLRSPIAEAHIKASVQGSVRDSVSFNALAKFVIDLPPRPEQQKISAVLSAADAELETLETQLSALRTQKRGLMQQLLTGKTRVSLY